MDRPETIEERLKRTFVSRIDFEENSNPLKKKGKSTRKNMKSSSKAQIAKTGARTSEHSSPGRFE